MLVACPTCEKQFKLRDDKLPDAGVFRITCPSCSGEIVVRRDTPDIDEPDASVGEKTVPLEPEVFPVGVRVAFVLVDHGSTGERLKSVLQEKGYAVSEAGGAAEAVEKVRMNRYHLLCIEDGESGREVLNVVNSWPGIRRREVNVVMLGEQAHSLDPGISFYRGVNGWLHPGDGDLFGDLLEQLEENFVQYRAPWDAVTES